MEAVASTRGTSLPGLWSRTRSIDRWSQATPVVFLSSKAERLLSPEDVPVHERCYKQSISLPASPCASHQRHWSYPSLRAGFRQAHGKVDPRGIAQLLLGLVFSVPAIPTAESQKGLIETIRAVCQWGRLVNTSRLLAQAFTKQ